MAIQPINSYWDEVQPYLLEQYKESPNLIALIQLFMGLLDPAETGFQELLTLLDIQACEGAQLDMLGRIANVARNGVSDAAYRITLTTWFTTRQSGAPEDIIRTVQEITGSDSVIYSPEYPAGFWIYYNGSGLTQSMLNIMSPAGVQGMIGCYLVFADGDTVVTAASEMITVVGPCDVEYPDDNLWDGGVAAIDPAAAVFTEPWPFMGGDGIGQYPDGLVGPADPMHSTFTDFTWADDDPTESV